MFSHKILSKISDLLSAGNLDPQEILFKYKEIWFNVWIFIGFLIALVKICNKLVVKECKFS